MDVIKDILTFLADNVFGQVPILIGLITLIGLIVIQQILFNMVMPRLMGRIVGLHPLLVFAAILIGAVLAGTWGILFGVPIAGVIASVLQFFYLRAIAKREPAAETAVTH